MTNEPCGKPYIEMKITTGLQKLNLDNDYII